MEARNGGPNDQTGVCLFGGGVTRANIFNRANLGIEVMHERNAHNFPLDLA